MFMMLTRPFPLFIAVNVFPVSILFPIFDFLIKIYWSGIVALIHTIDRALAGIIVPFSI